MARWAELGQPPQLPTLADRLEWLFQNVRAPSGGRYPLREVADWIRTETGEGITASYLQAMLAGKQDNPGIKKVLGLAKFFNCRPSFLLGEDGAAAEAQHMLAVEQDKRLEAVVAKARGLSPRGLRVVDRLVEELIREEE